MRVLSFAAVLVLISAVLAPVHAEDCALKLITSVDTTMAPSGRMAVPVTISGKPHAMLIDTGGVISEITPAIAAELGLPTRHTRLLLYDIAGNAVDEVMDVQDFKLGNLQADYMQLFISHGGLEVDGILAPNILRAYDVELDFKHNKLSIFSQDHCKGQVIHWPAAAVAIVPIKVTAAGHITLPVEVDGHRLIALLDTGASQTAMNMRNATGTFRLKPGTDMEELGSLQRQGSKVYGHRFKALTIEGLTVNNPYMEIIPDMNRDHLRKAPPLGTKLPTNDEAQGLEDMIIGMSTLKHLHLYIAYKEENLYITAGE